MLEIIWMQNELIQANEMIFMNFWYVVHYGASFGDDIDAKMNYFKHIKWYPLKFGTLNAMVQELEMILSQKNNKLERTKWLFKV